MILGWPYSKVVHLILIGWKTWPSGDMVSFPIYHILTSIALDTRLLAKAYRTSQIELSSPWFQKSCRGLIRGLIPGLIYFCPALPSSRSRPGGKKRNICKTIVKVKESERILAYFYLIPTKIRERSGSVVECLTQDRGAADSSLTWVTALWSLSKTHLS